MCVCVCVSTGARQLPRMLQALTSVARLSFSMTLLSRPSSPLSARLPTRHPSDGLLPRYRKSSAAAGLTTAESMSTDTEWSSPLRTGGVRACRTDERPARRRYDLQLSPPRERSRSDATAYYRRLDQDGLIDGMCGRPHRRYNVHMNNVTADAGSRDATPHVNADVK